MAEHGTVARPYAQAAFEIAKADSALGAWSQLLQLAATIAVEPELKRLMFAPGADSARIAQLITDLCVEKLGASGPLANGAKSVGGNFIRLLAEGQRLAVLPDISARFEVLKSEAENTLDVTLTSATDVSAEQQKRIAESLQKRFGRQVRLEVHIDKTLIGGARLQVGDRVIDGTVRTGLEKLATALRT